MPGSVPTLEILGVPFARLDAEAALAEIERLYDSQRPGLVVHANVHTVNLAASDPAYGEVLRSAELVLNDGKGVMLAASLNGRPFPQDLNGNFFSPLLLERAAARGWPVFFLGAKPGVAARAAERLTERFSELRVVGVRDGYFSAEQESDVLDQIRSSGAGLLLVGLGNPAQEKWLARCLAETGARVGVGVGAFFDFQAGEIQRAPGWMNRLGIEWVHRLIKEPKRMWRRYLVGNPLFVLRVLRSRARRV